MLNSKKVKNKTGCKNKNKNKKTFFSENVIEYTNCSHIKNKTFHSYVMLDKKQVI